MKSSLSHKWRIARSKNLPVRKFTRIGIIAFMKSIKFSLVLLLTTFAVLLILRDAAAASSFDAVVRSVVRISARDSNGASIFASGFIVQSGTGRSTDSAWLVTARHILENNAGDTITIGMRRNMRGIFVAQPVQVKIKERGQKLFSCHAEFDLAALKILLPGETDNCLLARDFLADDRRLERSNYGPGSQVLIAGFPYGEACNEAGFAFTRTGVISSFPVLPAGMFPIFYVDFEVFAGYSGAPIVLADSSGSMFLVGMALEEVFLEELRPQKNKKTLRTQRGLGLAKALSATVIKEFLSSLR